MKTLTHYDPFTDLAPLDRMWDVSDLLSKFMLRPYFRGGMEMEPQMKMDIKEVGGDFLVTAEMPGVNKDDIHVTVEGNRVSISAEIRHEKEAKEGERWICSERTYGMASRSFTLAAEIDQSKVVAKCNNGLLELTLPKKLGTVHREVPIT